MKKNIIKCSIYFLSLFIFYVLIISLLNYFDVVYGTAFKIINFVFVSILMFSSGFYLARSFNSKGYKAGIIMGVINMSILLIISLLLKSEYHISTLIYFFILLLSSTIGGMAGINFNNKKGI